MVISRLRTIFTIDEINRISIKEDSEKKTCITVDVHGMRCYEARRFINNIINIVHKAFQLIIIHGYNHGTAIKEMLVHNFKNVHIYEQFLDQRNKGMTHMLITV